MRAFAAMILTPLAACSMAVQPSPAANLNNAAQPAPVNAATPVNASNAVQADKIGESANVTIATGNSSADAGDRSDGRELPEGSANLDFVAVNRTGQTIRELAISPAGEESWSDNLIREELPDGERGAASFTRDYEVCAWDVRVTYQGGSRQSWPRINLCDTVRVELR